jgi:hypothetical protein
MLIHPLGARGGGARLRDDFRGFRIRILPPEVEEVRGVDGDLALVVAFQQGGGGRVPAVVEGEDVRQGVRFFHDARQTLGGL